MVREAQLKFTREFPGTLTVRNVTPDGIRINEDWWQAPLALTPEKVLSDFDIVTFAELSIDHLAPLLELSPELVIVGTGAVGQLVPRELMFAFARSGIGLEVMDTAAAERTFNVLAGEGRRVAAVLYPDQDSA